MKRFISLLAILFIITSWSVYATVSDTETPLKIYTSGSTTEYPIPFEYISDDDIVVTLYDPDTATEIAQTLDVDYTIVDSTVTYDSAPGSEFYVIIQRVTPFTQEASFQAGQAPPLSRYESAFDKLTYQTQDLNERLERSLLIPGTSSLRDLVFPDPAYNAGKGIRFKNDGTGIEGYEVFENGLTINIAKLSDYASFEAMIAAVGSTQKTIIIDTAVTLTTHGIVPSTMRLDFYRTGCITLGSYNLTFTSTESIQANKAKIFNCNASGEVSFLYSSSVCPEWWGTDGTALNASSASMLGGGTLFLHRSYIVTGLWTISNPITVNMDGATVSFPTNTTNQGIKITASSVHFKGYGSISGPQYLSNVDSQIGIWATGASKTARITDITIDDGININNWGGAGVHYDFVDYTRTNCTVENVWRYGIFAASSNHGYIGPRTRVKNVIGDDGAVYGIAISGHNGLSSNPIPEDWVVDSPYIEGVTNWEGIDTHGGKHIVIINPYIVDCLIGINITRYDDGESKVSPSDCWVMNPRVINASLNQATEVYWGIGIFGDCTSTETYGANCGVIGGVVEGYGDSNADDESGSAVYSYGIDGLKIDGVTIKNAGTRSICLRFTGDGLDVTNNILSGLAGTGYALWCSSNGGSPSGQITNNIINIPGTGNTAIYSYDAMGLVDLINNKIESAETWYDQFGGVYALQYWGKVDPVYVTTKTWNPAVDLHAVATTSFLSLPGVSSVCSVQVQPQRETQGLTLTYTPLDGDTNTGSVQFKAYNYTTSGVTMTPPSYWHIKVSKDQ